MEKLSAPGANRGSTAPPTSRIPPVAGFAHRRCHQLVMMAGWGGHDVLDTDEGDEEVRRAGVVAVEVMDALIERILLLVTRWHGRLQIQEVLAEPLLHDRQRRGGTVPYAVMCDLTSAAWDAEEALLGRVSPRVHGLPNHHRRGLELHQQTPER